MEPKGLITLARAREAILRATSRSRPPSRRWPASAANGPGKGRPPASRGNIK